MIEPVLEGCLAFLWFGGIALVLAQLIAARDWGSGYYKYLVTLLNPLKDGKIPQSVGLVPGICPQKV